MSAVARLCCLVVLGSAVAACTSTSSRPQDDDKVFQSTLDLGVGYIRNGEYQSAKENLTKALKLRPRSPKVHDAFGTLFRLEGEVKLAEEHFKIAINSSDDYTPARNNYGAFLFEQGRYEEAVTQLGIAAEDRFYRGRAQVYENLGVSYLHLDNAGAAEQSFARAVALNPGQARALVELATIHFDDRNYVEARSLYDRYLGVAQQTARSLWLGIRLARIFDQDDREASYTLLLKNVFPASTEYRALQESGS